MTGPAPSPRRSRSSAAGVRATPGPVPAAWGTTSMRSRSRPRCLTSCPAASRDPVRTRSARRATGGTTTRHRRAVPASPGSGATIQVTSWIITTVAARVRKGPVIATLCRRSTSRPAIAPRTVSSVTAFRRARTQQRVCSELDRRAERGRFAQVARAPRVAVHDEAAPGHETGEFRDQCADVAVDPAHARLQEDRVDADPPRQRGQHPGIGGARQGVHRQIVTSAGAWPRRAGIFFGHDRRRPARGGGPRLLGSQPGP